MINAISRTMVVAVAVFAIPMATSSAADVNFAGKTIRLIVNFSAGGPSDVFARYYQKYLPAFIPGNPTVIVEDRPGAGGMVAANYLYNLVKPDGLTIGSLTALAVDPMLGEPNIKFDITKFGWLGAVQQTQVLMVRKDIGVRTPPDLLKPAKPLIYGTTGVNAAYINTRLLFELMGVKYKLVSGYRGQARTIQALRRGEINVTDLGISGYLPQEQSFRNEGIMFPILQRGVLGDDGKLHRLAALPNLPTMEEAIAAVNPQGLKSAKFAAIKAVLGTYRIQFGFLLPPGAPKPIVDVLRESFARMFGDPAIKKATMARFKVEHQFIDGASTQRFVKKLFANYAANTEVRNIIHRIFKTRGLRKRRSKG